MADRSRDLEHHKLTELDAIRGIAALIVFMGHFFEGLVPTMARSVNGTLLYGALNGPGAVIVFFVLSGFVLTLHPLQARRWGLFVRILLKRWPRLAGPIVVAGFAYWLIAKLDAFPHGEMLAAKLPPHPPPYLFWGQAQHNEHLGAVLQEALAGTFLSGSAQHNPVLWTMHWELLGSFLAVALAATTLLRLPVIVRGGLIAALWLAAAACSPWLIAFPVGVLGAAVHGAVGGRMRIGNVLATGMLLFGAALLSWDIRVQVGIWRWTGALSFSVRFSAWVAAETVAAGLWMAVALYNPAMRRLLSGPFGLLSGRMSFSLYLIHLLVLCSLSAWLFILVIPSGLGILAVSGLFIVSLAATVILATPLMIFDQWWIRVLRFSC
jgi:peptidoglycan/LPS O-acetylase OafA/YrhL